MAETKVTIGFREKENVDSCLKALEESDRRLAAGPKTGGYDWQFVMREETPGGGANVHFGVVWYETELFEAKKNVFKDPFHTRIFEKFGVTSDDVIVSHWIRVAD